MEKSLYKSFCDKIIGYDGHVKDAVAQFSDWHKKEFDRLFAKFGQPNQLRKTARDIEIFSSHEKYEVLIVDLKTGMSLSTGQMFTYSMDFLNITRMTLRDRINMIKMFLTLNKCRAKGIVYRKKKDAYTNDPKNIEIYI